MSWSWDHFMQFLFSDYMLSGVWTTIWLSIVAMVLGCSLGVVVAFMKMSKNLVLRQIANTYIWIWRGTPLLVQMVIIYTVLPKVGIKLGVVESAIIALSLHEAAYFAEIVRSGILSVNKGQEDASLALGMTWAQRMRIVIIPQATRVIIPPLGNQFNLMIKTTSLASVISMEELFRRTQQLAQLEFKVLEAYMCAACWYLLMTTVWGLVQKRLEAHYDRPFGPVAADDGKRPNPVLTGQAAQV
ncbi:amino acid ABC transporter permease [Roseivivax sp. GX 12232]|uniref:amino acid ABC transporter permease n=1 Tax=Roseivivax sp. GX 12232 TaxID=2900547 RepID=UPI001E56D2E9|nr:amino acid ABC transporter permease [Roseivivax sp. GX 12232]MCE0504965.1 amino acid ABC transporter permease [Roseivivax sp. GX 12232]